MKSAWLQCQTRYHQSSLFRRDRTFHRQNLNSQITFRTSYRSTLCYKSLVHIQSILDTISNFRIRILSNTPILNQNHIDTHIYPKGFHSHLCHYCGSTLVPHQVRSIRIMGSQNSSHRNLLRILGCFKILGWLTLPCKYTYFYKHNLMASLGLRKDSLCCHAPSRQRHEDADLPGLHSLFS